MSKLSKLSVLLFVLVLSISGTGKYNYGNLLSAGQGSHSGFQDSGFVSSNSNDVFCLNPATEIVVSSVNNFPAPDSKKYSSGSEALPFFPESGIQSLASQYISHAAEIYPALSIREIIFPFHYFW